MNPEDAIKTIFADFLNVKDTSSFSIIQPKIQHSNSPIIHVSGPIFGLTMNRNPSIEFLKLKFIFEKLENDVERGYFKELSRFSFTVPTKLASILPEDENNKESVALYQIKLLCARYMGHIFDELHQDNMNREINNAADNVPEAMTNYGIAIGNALNSSPSLKLKAWAFAEIYKAKDIAEASNAVAKFSKELQQHRIATPLYLLQMIAILITFPISVPILAKLSYDKRGTYRFYQPDSQVFAEQIKAEAQNVLSAVK